MEALLSVSLSFFLFAHTILASPTPKPAFPAMFAFGNSFTDTGNALISQNYSVDSIEQYLPYGITYFHKPTGRLSDGRVVIDFLAQRLQAPLLTPFLSLPPGSLASEHSFVNFAVGGATAQSAEFLRETLNISIGTPYSVDVQLDWLKQLLGDAKEVNLQNALVYFGEIGHNDYFFALNSGKSYAEVFSSVSNVTVQIQGLMETLIDDGAKYIVVEGNLPMGCDTFFQRTWTSSPKDQYGCIQPMNELSQMHNEQLQKVIHRLSEKYPHVNIVYFDYYEAYIEVLKRPNYYGFTNTADPCLDVLLLLNVPFNLTAFKELPKCPDPSQYVLWDGVHLTEAMYKVTTSLFFDKGFVDPYPNFLTKRNV